MLYSDFEIKENKELVTDVYQMVLKVDTDLDMVKPGQFINIKINQGNDPLLRRPISICDVDYEAKTIRIVYRIEGRGTKLLADKKVGDLLNIIGPLGNGFCLPNKEDQKVILIGGGIGVPPLLMQAKLLKANNYHVVTVLGFTDSSKIILKDEFKQFGDVYIATNDGSSGYKGTVIDVIENNKLDFDSLFACGPKPMLKAIDEKYQGLKEGYIAFEERMACGIGACYGCICKTKTGETKRVCKDGPAFALGVIDYE